MKRLASHRRGFALAVALAAIVIIGGLIAGIFFASTQEFRIGRNSILQTRALSAAEYGLNAIVSRDPNVGWKKGWNTSAGGVVATKQYDPGDGSSAKVSVTSLGNGYFQVVSEGRAGADAGALGRRRIAALATVGSVSFKILGALTTRGPISIGGSSQITGNDSSITGWDCPPAGADLPGVAINDPSQIKYNGCKNCVVGNPAVQTTPVANSDSTYNQFGDANWALLTAMADKSYPAGTTLNGMAPVLSGGVCDVGVQSNWGDPKLALGIGKGCADYFPIIYAKGDLHVTGGYGQGILLVEGGLDVSGGFEFYGPVDVKGTLTVTGTGGHFNGGVMAQNADLDQSKIAGNALVSYSSCAVQKASLGAAFATLARGRSWTELY